MVDAHSAIAGYLRGLREAAGLTRAELAKRASVSEALIQKVEQGTRQPTSTALGALFEALDAPVLVREHAAAVLQPELTGLVTDGGYPGQAELDFLNSLPYPACYQTQPALDLIAANDAYRRAFPGLEPGINIIAWMLLDPIARYLIDDWEKATHLMVYVFKHMAPGVTDPDRIEAITSLCAKSPDWERFWSTHLAAAEVHSRPGRFRSPDTGDWMTMQVQVFRCEVPRRSWWMYTLTPVPDAE